MLVIAKSQRTAIEGFFVRVVEFETAGPSAIFANPVDEQIDTYVRCLLTSLDSAHIPRVEPAPQQRGPRVRYCQQVASVNRHSGTFAGCALVAAFFLPALDADVPEGQRLHGGCLARVVRTDKDHRVAQLNFGFFESLEVANSELGEHRLIVARARTEPAAQSSYRALREFRGGYY